MSKARRMGSSVIMATSAIGWALQTEVHYRLQVPGHGGPEPWLVCPVPVNGDVAEIFALDMIT